MSAGAPVANFRWNTTVVGSGALMVSTMLYQVDSLDLTTFALAPLLFLSIALLASYLPARGATKVDPVKALRGN